MLSVGETSLNGASCPVVAPRLAVVPRRGGAGLPALSNIQKVVRIKPMSLTRLNNEFVLSVSHAAQS